LLPEWPKRLPSNEYAPIDFSDRRSLQLASPYSLGPEQRIV